MNINYETYTINQDCSTCTHAGVCKWSSAFKESKDKNSTPKKDIASPIKINVTCSEYIKKNNLINDSIIYKW